MEQLMTTPGNKVSSTSNGLWNDSLDDLSPDSNDLFADLDEAMMEDRKVVEKKCPPPVGEGMMMKRKNRMKRKNKLEERKGSPFGEQILSSGVEELNFAKKNQQEGNDDEEEEIRRVNQMNIDQIEQDDEQEIGVMSSNQEEQRLIDESEQLARQLMMEEQNQLCERLQAEQLRMMSEMQQISDSQSESDIAYALRIVAEEEEQIRIAQEEAVETVDVDPDEMSYDQLVELGERIGNVKQERWQIDGKEYISTLKTTKFDSESIVEGEDLQCVICQYTFQQDEELKILPCNHRFHSDCIDPWLKDHDTCVTCKQSLKEMITLS